MKTKYDWKYGENKEQKYYEAKIGDDYLCVYANRWSPQIWMAIVNDRLIHNKTRNNRQRKKQGLPLRSALSAPSGLHFVQRFAGIYDEKGRVVLSARFGRNKRVM